MVNLIIHKPKQGINAKTEKATPIPSRILLLRQSIKALRTKLLKFYQKIDRIKATTWQNFTIVALNAKRLTVLGLCKLERFGPRKHRFQLGLKGTNVALC